MLEVGVRNPRRPPTASRDRFLNSQEPGCNRWEGEREGSGNLDGRPPIFATLARLLCGWWCVRESGADMERHLDLELAPAGLPGGPPSAAAAE